MTEEENLELDGELDSWVDLTDAEQDARLRSLSTVQLLKLQIRNRARLA